MSKHHGQRHLPRRPQGSAWKIYKRLVLFASSYWPYFLAAIFANLCYASIDASFTYLLKPLLDVGFIEKNTHFLRWAPLLLIGLFFVRAVANFAGNYWMTWVGRSVVFKFRQQIFEHFLKIPASYFDHHSAGQLLSLLTYNTSQVSNACTEAVSSSVQSAFLVLGLLIVMFTISWRLTLIFLITIPTIAIVVKLMSRRLRKLNLRIQESMGVLTQVTEEVIEAYKVVRIFGGEKYEMDKLTKAAGENAKFEMKAVVTKCFNVSFVQFIGIFSLALMVVFATLLSHHQQLTAGAFAAMVAAMLAMLKPLKELTTVNSIIQRGLAGAESIFQMIDQDVEKDTGTVSINRARGLIHFKQVSFSYAQTHARQQGYVLNNITLTIEPGQSIALVGHSGGGKSTFIQLLPRFYEVTEGVIELDGISLSEYRLQDLRQQFALVSQHVTLFNDTIANNIAYGPLAQQVSETDIIAAAQAAHAIEFIEKLPEGLQTRIGENGVLLSGGQRQRLAIARAILKNAPILILDEATSALDTESERLIQDALTRLMHQRTTIVIAHRLSTIETVDKIIVLEKGRIIEQGTHQELLTLGGHYAKLYQLQFKN